MLKLTEEPPVWRASLPGHKEINRALLAALAREIDGPHARRSHLELGRYENTYIAREAIPEVEPLCQAALSGARQILARDHLRFGFWFNIMQPGDRTARHNHEEGDELLSCVYYLEAPRNSGDLLLYPPRQTLQIPPASGHLVYFPPRLAHAVDENRSDRRRVSVAFNFGPEGP